VAGVGAAGVSVGGDSVDRRSILAGIRTIDSKRNRPTGWRAQAGDDDKEREGAAHAH
jgi:hypothetical protein